MSVIIHLESRRVRLIVADEHGLQIRANWPTRVASENPMELRSELQSHLDECILKKRKLIIVVDLSGDTVFWPFNGTDGSGSSCVPLGFGGVNSQWLESNLRKHLGQREFGVGLFEVGEPFVSQKDLKKKPISYAVTRIGLRGSVQRYYLLPETFEYSPWLILLKELHGLSIDAIYPSALLMEQAEIPLLKQAAPVLLCHYDLQRVVRHSLYVEGKVRFTRLLPLDDSSLNIDENRVFIQIRETLDYLKTRSFDFSESPVALLPSDVPLPEDIKLENEERFLVLPEKVLGTENKNLSETDRYLFSILRKPDRRQQAQLKSIDFGGLVQNQKKLNDRPSRQKMYLLLISFCLLCITGWNLFHHVNLKKLNGAKLVESRQLSELVRQAPLHPELMRSMVLTYRQLTHKWSLPQKMLTAFGKLHVSYEQIKLDRLDWCWSGLDERCLNDVVAGPIAQSRQHDNSASAAIIVRLTGVIDAEFSSLRAELEHYQQWVSAIDATQSFALVRHEQWPYQGALKTTTRHETSSNSTTRSVDQNQFVVVFSYSSVKGAPQENNVGKDNDIETLRVHEISDR